MPDTEHRPPSNTPPTPPPDSGLFSRGAIGFWFLGLGLLGLVRSWMRATRGGSFDADFITLLWLIGSAVLTLMGAARVWRSWREGRGPDA